MSTIVQIVSLSQAHGELIIEMSGSQASYGASWIYARCRRGRSVRYRFGAKLC